GRARGGAPARLAAVADRRGRPRGRADSGRLRDVPPMTDGSRVLRREWATAEGWRGTRLGMWAWLIQRAAAIGLLGVVALHLINPFRRGVQAALLALALLHALLGVRSLLLDVGVPLRWHRALFVGALVLTAGVFVLIWRVRWY